VNQALLGRFALARLAGLGFRFIFMMRGSGGVAIIALIVASRRRIVSASVYWSASGGDFMVWSSILARHPKHVQAIGMISIENANIDLALCWLLGAVLGVSGEVANAIYMTPKQAQTRLDIFRSVMRAHLQPSHVKDPPNVIVELLDKTEDFFKRANTLSQKRHSVMHDVWGANESDEVVRDRLPIKDFLNSGTVAPLPELQAIIHGMRVLISEIQAITKKLQDERLQWLSRHSRELLAIKGAPIPGNTDNPKTGAPPRPPKRGPRRRSSPG
jgi:hypothetical protein